MYKIIESNNGKHIGSSFQSIEKGQVLTFENGDVYVIDKVFYDETNEVFVKGKDFQLTFTKM